MYELTAGVSRQRVGDEVLRDKCGLAISWRNIVNKTLYFATDDFVKSFAYFAMMIADNKPHPRLMLEHVTGEIQHTGKTEGTLYVYVATRSTALILFVKF